MRTLKTIILILLFTLAFQKSYSQSFIWRHTNGPMGGIVGDLAFDKDGNLIAGIYSWMNYSWSHYKDYAGLYRTTDNGNSWKEIPTPPFQPFEVYSLYVSKAGHIFVGTKYQHRIYRSTDNGISWASISNGYNANRTLAIGESKDGVLFAGGTNAFYRSTNNGDSWQLIRFLTPLVFATDSNNTIWCGTLSGLIKSTNNGISWDSIDYFVGAEVSSIAFNSQGHIFVGTGYYYSLGTGVFYSTNGGNSWTHIGLWGDPVFSLAFDNNGRLFAGTKSMGLFSTTNLGANWVLHTNGIKGNEVFRLKITPQNHIFVGSENEGVYRSTDGGASFTQVGVPVSYIQNIDFSPDRRYIFASTPSGVQRYDRLQKKWENMGFKNVEYLSISPSGDLYAAVYQNELYLSQDYGITWQLFPQDTNIVERHTFKAINESLLVDGSYPNYRISNDYGITWKTLNYSAPFRGSSIYHYDNKIFLGAYSKIVYTSDFGTTVNEILLPSTLWGNNSITVNALGELMYSTYGGIYKSSTNYNNWNKVLNLYTTCIYSSENIIYAGTRNGIVRSVDNGNSWDFIFTEDTLRNTAHDLKIIDNKLYIATNSYGLYELDLPVSVNDKFEIPNEFTLYQNYPNPFSATGSSASGGNPGTTISWQSAVGSWQTIKLYDVLGREIETIVDGYYEAGKHSKFYILNSTLPSGVYFYRLQAGNFVETKKMILMR